MATPVSIASPRYNEYTFIAPILHRVNRVPLCTYTWVMTDYICTNIHISIYSIYPIVLSTLCLVKFNAKTQHSKSIPGPNIHIYPHLIPGIHLCIMFQQTVHDVKMSTPSCPMKSRSLALQRNFTSIKSLDRLYFNGHFPVKSRSEYVSWHFGNP
jgi:hypothetical protein